MSLKRFTRDLEPRPAVTIRAATVNGKPVADPAAYDALLADLPLGDPPDRLGRAVVIRLTPDVVTTMGRPASGRSPTSRRSACCGAGPTGSPSPRTSLRRSRPTPASTKPAPPPSASASGFPAGNLAAVLAALAVVGLGVVVVSRRRTRSRGT